MRTSIISRTLATRLGGKIRQGIKACFDSGRAVTAGVAILGGGLAFVGGLPSASAIELVQNGGFETNDGFDGQNVGFSWDNADGPPNFDVYSHSTQVYYEGIAPPSSDAWYYHSVGVPGGVRTQSIDLTANFSGAEIDEGDHQFNFSGYLAGYTPQQDHAILELTFLDGGGNQIGGAAGILDGGAPLAGDGLSIDFNDPDSFVEFADPSFSDTVPANFPTNPTAAWKLYRDIAGVPVGARTAVVSIVAVGNDDYVDNVSLDVVDTDQSQFLSIEVNKTNGTISMTNGSPSALDINYYEISSAGGTLSTGWDSFADQMLDSQGPNPEDNWQEGGGSNSTLLTEAFLSSSNFALSETQTLANAYTGGGGGAEDLVFNYGLSDGRLIRGIVTYITPTGVPGDYNGDGTVNLADYTIWRDNLGASDESAFAPGTGNGGGIDVTDYTAWKTNFGNSGAGALESASVPEPTSIVMVAGAFGLLLTCVRARKIA